MTPLVSILIPCHNAARWVRHCIESALSQTYPHKEVLVVDDGSSDQSLQIIREFGDRIFWETSPNRGGNAARNRLLQLARGQWLQYLDADDYLLPDKIANQMEFIKTETTNRKRGIDLAIIFGPTTLEYWSEQGTRRIPLPIPEGADAWELLARWHLPGTGSGIWLKDAIVDVGGWDERQPCCQEHELYLRLLMAEKRFTICSHNGLIYRQWGPATVSKRNAPEVHRRRLEIEQRAEDFLRQTGELTRPRLRAINQARFEIARNAWPANPRFSLEIMQTVQRSDPAFLPAAPSGPFLYRAALRMFGFAQAERLAAIKRKYC